MILRVNSKSSSLVIDKNEVGRNVVGCGQNANVVVATAAEKIARKNFMVDGDNVDDRLVCCLHSRRDDAIAIAVIDIDGFASFLRLLKHHHRPPIFDVRAKKRYKRHFENPENRASQHAYSQILVEHMLHSCHT